MIHHGVGVFCYLNLFLFKHLQIYLCIYKYVYILPRILCRQAKKTQARSEIWVIQAWSDEIVKSTGKKKYWWICSIHVSVKMF